MKIEIWRHVPQKDGCSMMFMESDSICNLFLFPCIVFLNWWGNSLQCHVGVCHQQCESAVSIHVSPLSPASGPQPPPHPSPVFITSPCKLHWLLDKLAHLYASFSLFPFPFWWMIIVFSLWGGRLNGESSHSAYNPGGNTVSSSSLSTGIFSAKLSAWKIRISKLLKVSKCC